MGVLFKMFDFPIVFIDEAAQCSEVRPFLRFDNAERFIVTHRLVIQPAALIPLVKGSRQVTLLGDHKQLPQITEVRASLAMCAYHGETLTFYCAILERRS
jgi:superfamily I DNA and/or RNA helicase